MATSVERTLNDLAQVKVTKYRCANGHEWEKVEQLPPPRSESGFLAQGGYIDSGSITSRPAVFEEDGILRVTIGGGPEVSVCMRCMTELLGKMAVVTEVI